MGGDADLFAAEIYEAGGISGRREFIKKKGVFGRDCIKQNIENKSIIALYLDYWHNILDFEKL